MSETVRELLARIKADQADHLAQQQAALDEERAATLARMQARRQQQEIRARLAAEDIDAAHRSQAGIYGKNW